MATLGGSQLPDGSGQSLPSTDCCEDPFACDTVLVLDCSGSMSQCLGGATRLDAAQAAANAFVDERIAHPAARIAVIGFHDIALPVCPLTPSSSPSTLRNAIRSLRADKCTNMSAALDAAAQWLVQSDGQRRRQEILFLTDGHNTGACPLPISERLKRLGCLIFTVGIGGKRENVDETLLKQLASCDHNGRPLYRFIEEQTRLVRHFEALGRITR